MPDGSRAISGIVGPDAARMELESGFMWPPFMIAELNNHFWDRLLTRMEMQKVIPVVGPGAITFGRGGDILHLWLAQKVAAKCHPQLPAADLPKTLQQVIDEQRRGGATPEE